MILKSSEEWMPIEGILPPRRLSSNGKTFEYTMIAILAAVVLLIGLYLYNDHILNKPLPQPTQVAVNGNVPPTPQPSVIAAIPNTTTTPSPTRTLVATAVTETPKITPTGEITITPAPTSKETLTPSPTPTPTMKPTPSPSKATPKPTVVAAVSPTVTPTPQVSVKPSPGVTVALTPKVTMTASPKVTVKPSPRFTVALTPKITLTPTPKVTVAFTPKVTSAPSPKVTIKPTPRVSVAATPKITPSAAPTVVAVAPVPFKPARGSEELMLEKTPELREGCHILSLRTVLEKDNWRVTWDARNRRALAVKGSEKLEIDADKQQYTRWLNKNIKVGNTPIYVENGHVMVPYRLLATNLDQRVSLDTATKKVYLVATGTPPVAYRPTPKPVVRPTPAHTPVAFRPTAKPPVTPKPVAIRAATPSPIGKDEVELVFDVKPELKNGSHMISFRGVLESDHWTVAWDNTSKNATAAKNSHKLEIIPEKQEFIKQVEQEMKSGNTNVYIKNGRIMVPYRFLSTQLKDRVRIDPESKRVYLKVNGKNGHAFLNSLRSLRRN